MWIWLASAVIFLLLVVAVIGCRRVNILRQVSHEGIKNDEVVQAYNRISKWPQFRLLRRIIAGEIGKCHPEGIMVDVGCGPGYLVTTMAKSFPRLRIIGVDIAEEMVELATCNISAVGFSERVEFRQGNVQELPFEDNSVDFVVSTLSLHHWSDPKQALEEIHRVLGLGGQLLVFDLRRDAKRLFYWLLHFAQTFVVPAALRRIGEPTGSARSSYTADEIEAIISKTPFQKHRVNAGFGWMFIWGGKIWR